MDQAELIFVEICEKLIESYICLQSNVNDIIEFKLNQVCSPENNSFYSIITPEKLITSLEKISQKFKKIIYLFR